MERANARETPSLLAGHEAFLDSHREQFRNNLTTCILAARAYDGTETLYRSLFETLEAFEAWQLDTFGPLFADTSSHRLAERSEEALLVYYHPTVTTTVRSIGQLLRLAVERCSRRLLKEQDILAVRAQWLDGTLLPTGPGQVRPPGKGSEPFKKEAIFTPRLRLLLGALQEQGIFLEDVLLWVGKPQEGALKRTQSYVLVEIPRLQGRQVLICDEKGEGVYVIFYPFDPKEILIDRKNDLQAEYPDRVKWVDWVDEDAWKAEIMHLLFLEVAVGEKVNIALREDLRRQIKERYRLQDFIDEKGDAKFNYRGNTSSSPFVIAGRRFTALATIFGLSSEDASSRQHLAGLRFLAAVYGSSDPYLAPHLRRCEREAALTKHLGKDAARWRDYITGHPVQVLVQGELMMDRVSHPLPTREAILALGSSRLKKLDFAGESLWTLAPLFLSPEQLAELSQGPTVPGELFSYYIALALFGDDKDIQERLHTLRRDTKIQAALGTSSDRWKDFLKGEPVQIDEAGVLVAVRSAYPLPTVDALKAVPLRTLRTLRFADVSLPTIAKYVIPPEELIGVAPEALSPSESEYIFQLFQRAVYGSNAALDASIERLAKEYAVMRMVEKDPSIIAQIIRGVPLMIFVRGVSVSYVADHVFPRPDELLVSPAKVRSKYDFGGFTLQSKKLIQRFMGEGVASDFDPGNDQESLERFALKVYGNIRLASGESLADRVLRFDQRKAVHLLFGSDPKRWREFLAGTPAEVTIEGRVHQIYPEQIIQTRDAFLALSAAERREFSLNGMGLTGFARVLGFPRKSFNVLSQEGLERIANVLF